MKFTSRTDDIDWNESWEQIVIVGINREQEVRGMGNKFFTGVISLENINYPFEG